MSGDTVEATFYVQIAKAIGTWGGAQQFDGRMRNARMVKATTRRPDQLEPGAVAVKLTVRLPRAAFDPLQPEAVIDVPAELIQHAIDIEATR